MSDQIQLDNNGTDARIYSALYSDPIDCSWGDVAEAYQAYEHQDPAGFLTDEEYYDFIARYVKGDDTSIVYAGDDKGFRLVDLRE